MNQEMSENDIQNKRLDQFGRKLLETARVRDEEIEKIVAVPQLFDSVKAEIKAAEHSRRKPKRFFGDWVTLSFWNRQRSAGALAILTVLAGGAAVIIFKTQDSPQPAEQTIKSETQTQITQVENPPPPSEIKETKIPAVKNRVSAEQIAFKPGMSKSPNRVRKPDSVKASRSNKKQLQEIFYSLGFAGNWEAKDEDLQIVRAELSRAELFALGVNLPVENESAKIKTDLLVSADGVARAIRFVE